MLKSCLSLPRSRVLGVRSSQAPAKTLSATFSHSSSNQIMSNIKGGSPMDVNAELLRSSFRSLFEDKIFKAGNGFEVDTEVLRDIFGRPGWGVQALQGEIEVLGKL